MSRCTFKCHVCEMEECVTDKKSADLCPRYKAVVAKWKKPGQKRKPNKQNGQKTSKSAEKTDGKKKQKLTFDERLAKATKVANNNAK